MHRQVSAKKKRLHSKRPYRIPSPTQSNTLVAILHVRIRRLEINTSISTISKEQSNLRNNLSLFLDLYYNVFMEVTFLKSVKIFYLRNILFFHITCSAVTVPLAITKEAGIFLTYAADMILMIVRIEGTFL